MQRIPLSRIVVAIAVVLAVATAPLAAQDLGSGPARLTATGCALGSCGEHGPSIDPNGLTAAGCELGSCGEHGPSSDPDGLTARPEAAGLAASFLARLGAQLSF